MPKPSKLLKKRSGIASARKSRHAKQSSPSPLPSPIPESNHSISAPATPPDSTFPTPYQTPDPEITFEGPEMMDQWPTDIEDPPLQDNQSDPEDEDGGCHSDDLLEEMDGDDLNLSLDFQMQREINFLKGLEEIGRVDSSTAFSELM